MRQEKEGEGAGEGDEVCDSCLSWGFGLIPTSISKIFGSNLLCFRVPLRGSHSLARQSGSDTFASFRPQSCKVRAANKK